MELTGRPVRSLAMAAVIVGIGGGGMIGQLVLLRVLMVVSYGTELVIAFLLAFWLAFEAMGAWIGARGAFTRRARALVPLGLSVYSVALPAVIVLARLVTAGLYRLTPGEAMGLGQTVLATVLVTLPTALLHGAMFPLSAHLLGSSRAGRATGRAYLIEILGSIAGALAFVFLLAPGLRDLQIAGALVALHLALAAFALAVTTRTRSPTARRARVAAAALALAAIAAAVLSPAAADRLHTATVGRLFATGEVVSYHNSPYGNIAVVEREAEHTVFYDGRPIISLPYPDTARLMDYAWLAALSHPHPAQALVLGGGMGGLLYHLLEHPVERLVYTEIDPLLPAIVAGIDAPIVQSESQDPRTRVVLSDGRLYLNRTRRAYDLIVLGDMEIETLQANRFFTVEFFRLARSRLDAGGVLVFSLPGSMTYLGAELGALNASIHGSAASVFSHLHLIPGDRNIILASHEPLDLEPATAHGRLAERGLSGGMFTRSYLEYRLDAARSERFTATLAQIPARLNHDFRPAGLIYGLRYWGRAFAPGALSAFALPPAAAAGLVAAGLLTAALALYALLLRSRASPANRLSWTIGTTGAAAMTFDLFTLFAVQSLLGYVYQFTGLFVAALLGGAFVGGRVTIARTHGPRGLPEKRAVRLLVLLDVALVLQLGAVIGFVHALRAMMRLPHAETLGAVAAVLVAAVSGALVGAQFPVAVALMPGPWRHSAGRTAGRLYTADLAGGCLAAVIVTLLLFPHLGMAWTLLLLAALKLTSVASLAAAPREAGRGRGRL